MTRLARAVAAATLTAALLSGTGAGALPCLAGTPLTDRCPAWVSTYDDGTAQLDSATAVAASATRVFVTGATYIPGQAHPMFDSTTIAYDAATGAKLWERRFDGVPDTWDMMNDIAVSADGSRVYVAGLGGNDFRGGGDFVVFAYAAADGALVWQARYDGGYTIDEAVALAVAGDRIYVTGPSLGDGTNRDYATVGLDAATGERLWASRYDGPARGLDQPVGIVASAERVVVTGYSAGAAGDDYTTIAYEAADPERLGEELWVRRTDASGGQDRATGIALSGDRVFVTGKTTDAAGLGQATTVALAAATGAIEWQASHAGAQAAAIATSGDRVVVAGSTLETRAAASNEDVLAIAYSAANGAPLWTHNPRTEGLQEAATHLAVSAHGAEVLLAGPASPVTLTAKPVIFTHALAIATGIQGWSARYENDSLLPYDGIEDLALDPGDLRLYIAGYSAAGPTENDIPREYSDYLTLAYAL